MKKHRKERVGDLISHEISMILRTKAADSRFDAVTVTGARVSSDLRIAHIYVSVLGDETARSKALKGLEQAARFFRGEVGRRLRMKYTPEIRFVFDEELERGQRIWQEIEQLRRETESEADGEEM